MASSEMLRRVALVRTDVSEDLSAYIVRVTRIGELGTLAVTSSPILVTLMTEVLSSSETSFLQEPHGVTSQKTPFVSLYRLKLGENRNLRR
jgi:predicted RNase H-like nuclease